MPAWSSPSPLTAAASAAAQPRQRRAPQILTSSDIVSFHQATAHGLVRSPDNGGIWTRDQGWQEHGRFRVLGRRQPGSRDLVRIWPLPPVIIHPDRLAILVENLQAWIRESIRHRRADRRAD